MHPQYKKAIALRLKGRSYGEIARALDVSKGSLSVWFRDLKLPKATQKLLEKKMKIAMEHNLFENNRRRTRTVQAENKKIMESAVGEIGPLSKYELLLIGAALYWGEGWKKMRGNQAPPVSLVNSDPHMIKLFLRFLREIIEVPEEKIKMSIRIHPNISAESTIGFWSRVTDIPQERFRITRQISKASQRKRPSHSLPYGTLDIRVSSRQRFFKIKGWIEGLAQQGDAK